MHLLTKRLFSCVLFLLISGFAYGYQENTHLQEGLAALRAGQKIEAWNLLFPYAQRGDVQAMFYLGDMMMRSPEYQDHLQRAIEFFRVAAEKGHAGAQKLLPQAQRILESKLSNAPRLIAGASGIPLENEIESVNRSLEAYKQNVLAFVDSPATTGNIPRVEILYFMPGADSAINSLYAKSQELAQRFGTEIKSRYFVNINAEDLRQGMTAGMSSLQNSGMTPDLGGEIASRYGINTLPAFVIVKADGTYSVEYSLSSLSQKLINILL
ncbi:hypothetical protein LCGC14_0171250 [marine sediment metagenome]|uniref:Thioredoxin-like fold domain-containing protein n=1 Tax=marine sediment metagenome TaxID=412755 RepID=A0A0F9USX8_9ZZZZ